MSEPFSAFMARALFDPERGYYTRNIRTVGARGDFSTSATLSPAFRQAVARWLKAEARVFPKVRHIIEVGAGDGSLMAGVRKGLGWWGRLKFHCHLVEASPVLARLQQAKLGGGVTWHANLAEALHSCDGAAFIYSNELLDAFPATLVEWRQGAWHEVYVTPAGQEELLPLSFPAETRSEFTALNSTPPKDGQRYELHGSVRDWMRRWAPAWHQGSVLAVDYGDLFPALYHRRPRGTLRAYLLQQRLEGREIYRNPGRQDITADVNFSDYRHWASSLGWEETFYGTQAAWLRSHLPGPGRDPRDAFVMDEAGAGGAFKCVTHRRRA